MAVATPAGAGALGVIRLSGPDAIGIASALLAAPSALQAQPSHTVRRVTLLDDARAEPLDEAMCLVMRTPRSYTGEDVVELSCHGSVPLLHAIVDRLRRAGARIAEPGEFTRRAFVNGRMDLARAEAVALLIASRTERAALLAARALTGELSTRVARIREALLDVIASLEVTLDFPDDDVGVDIVDVRRRVAAVRDDAEQLVLAAQRGRHVHQGITVALVGRPNAGKSSLLNALLGYDRAIVAATPGTTRDVVEGAMVIHGVAVRLLDTAGLGTAADEIEAEGMRRTRRALEESELAMLVLDGAVTSADDSHLRNELGDRDVIVVCSKNDIASRRSPDGAVSVSAKTGAGLPLLRERLARAIQNLAGTEHGDEVFAASIRQVGALEDIAAAVRAAHESLDAVPLEATLVDLSVALRGTSALLGVDIGESVLDRIFATFCVGK